MPVVIDEMDGQVEEPDPRDGLAQLRTAAPRPVPDGEMQRLHRLREDLRTLNRRAVRLRAD